MTTKMSNWQKTPVGTIERLFGKYFPSSDFVSCFLLEFNDSRGKTKVFIVCILNREKLRKRFSAALSVRADFVSNF